MRSSSYDCSCSFSTTASADADQVGLEAGVGEQQAQRLQDVRLVVGYEHAGQGWFMEVRHDVNAMPTALDVSQAPCLAARLHR